MGVEVVTLKTNAILYRIGKIRIISLTGVKPDSAGVISTLDQKDINGNRYCATAVLLNNVWYSGWASTNSEWNQLSCVYYRDGAAASPEANSYNYGVMVYTV